MARSWKTITSEEELADISVELKPLWGIPPGVWVSAVWGMVLLALVFIVAVLPGIRQYGTRMTVVSSPSGAAVLVDQEFRGMTPLTVFVPAGERHIRTELPGFAPWEETVNAGGRLVGSRFFPRKATISPVLTPDNPEYLWANVIPDFSSWALGSEPGVQFQHPPVARDGARFLWAGGSGASASREYQEYQEYQESYIRDLLAHAAPWHHAEVLGAVLRTSAPGGALTPAALQVAVQLFIQLDNEYQGLSPLVASLVPEGPPRDALAPWSEHRENQRSTELLSMSVMLDEDVLPTRELRSVAGFTFVRVPAGSYIIGYPLRTAGTTGVAESYSRDFWMLRDEVTREQYAQFLRDVPEWRRDAHSTPPHLDGFQEYLADWPENWDAWVHEPHTAGSAEGDLPVTGVHHEAAHAFTRWLQGVLEREDPAWRAWEVRLPTAAEWEYAAFLNGPPGPALPDGSQNSRANGPVRGSSATAGVLGARNLTGNVWEWTSDWFGRNGHIIPPAAGSHRVVMGGSFVNTDQAHNLRGAVPPEWANRFTGFRPVIVQISSEGASRE